MEKDLVTKNYLDLKLAELESRVEAKIIQWVAALLIVQSGVIAVLVKPPLSQSVLARRLP